MRSVPLPLAALAAGAVSAFAFQPVGWWPLMPLAFAALCEHIRRCGSLRQALPAAERSHDSPWAS